MNIIFFGSSIYSAIVEQAIFEKFGLALVVTIPDRIIGREKKLTPSPVKEFAEKNTIPLITTDKLTEEAIEKIATYHPDFLVVADYGLILPKELLALPTFAALNVHHSLLPKYRGTSPAPSAILAGEKISGVSVITMNDKVDAGDIMAQETYELKPDETTQSLLTILNTIGGKIILPVIENYSSITPIKQDEAKVIVTKPMNKTDGYIDQTNPPSKEQIDRMIRAYYPWPGVWTMLPINGKETRIKFLPGHPREGEDPSKLDSRLRENEILIQPEGKKPMNVKDFLNGYPEAKDMIEKFL